MRWLAIVLLIAGCSRGPDETALRPQVQAAIDKSFKPGLLELAALKRQGSSPLGAERVLVYYNATLRLRDGYDFKDWESLSVIARTITGTHWSGPAFFGTRKRQAA